jgi:hypothetical protein
LLRNLLLAPSEDADKTDTRRHWNANQYESPWSWTEISQFNWHWRITSRRRQW